MNLRNFTIIALTGTLCYTIASYYHLKLGNNWTFMNAFIIAIPLVIIEYIFSLHGNHYANTILKQSPHNILIITVCFYFVNLWLLNYFVLKHRIEPIHEIIAFCLIIAAFFVSTVFQR